MIRTTLVRCMQHVRRPMIKFPNRKQAQDPHTPHPHPAAPQQIAENFAHFQETFRSGPHFHPEKLESLDRAADKTRNQSDLTASQPGAGAVNKGIRGSSSFSFGSNFSSSSSSPSASGDVAEDLHDLPPRFWRRQTSVMDKAEMEAVMTGGASLLQ